MDLNKILKHDFVITLIVLVLVAIGSLVIYGATFNTTESNLILKQLILILIGLFLYFFIITLDIEWFRVFSIQMFLYMFIIGTLLYVNFFGSTIAGTNRWIDFGFFSFQPSEYAKILIILFAALIFDPDTVIKKRKEAVFTKFKKSKATIFEKLKGKTQELRENPEVKSLFFLALYTIPIVFLTFIQPALGNSIIIILLTGLTAFFALKNPTPVVKFALYFLLFASILFQFIKFDSSQEEFLISRSYANFFSIGISSLVIIALVLFLKTKIWQLLVTASLVFFSIAGVIFSWNKLLGDYQKARILTFVAGPETDPLGSGFQIIQSKIAIGSGQLLGRGYLQGTQSSLHILTQAYTDFAFASMSEQFGFIGSVLLLAIYTFLILRILKIGKETKSVFGRNFCFGSASLLLIHVFINVGMNIGKLPVTGIPLPLVSYGGSSVLMTLIILGLVQSIHASRRPVDMSDSLMITSLRGKETD